jgi:hypothetical protein
LLEKRLPEDVEENTNVQRAIREALLPLAAEDLADTLELERQASNKANQEALALTEQARTLDAERSALASGAEQAEAREREAIAAAEEAQAAWANAQESTRAAEGKLREFGATMEEANKLRQRDEELQFALDRASAASTEAERLKNDLQKTEAALRQTQDARMGAEGRVAVLEDKVSKLQIAVQQASAALSQAETDLASANQKALKAREVAKEEEVLQLKNVIVQGWPSRVSMGIALLALILAFVFGVLAFHERRLLDDHIAQSPSPVTGAAQSGISPPPIPGAVQSFIPRGQGPVPSEKKCSDLWKRADYVGALVAGCK